MEQDTFEDLISQFTTRKKMLMRHIRRSDGRIVEVERRMRDIAVASDQRGRDLQEIKDNTTWLSKFIGNMFKFGGSQAEQKYPSKKK